jgi:hypothetical protein
MNHMQDKFVVYDRKSNRYVLNTIEDAIIESRQILRSTPTKNGFVAPVSIWHNGVMIAVLSDDANGITVHRLTK